MDYQFFEALTAKIDAAQGDEKARLSQIREKALTVVNEIDESIAEQKDLRKQALEAILKAETLDKGIEQFGRAIDDAFIEIANAELAAARQASDFERSGKIQNLLDQIEEMMKVPAEFAFLQSLMQIEDIGKLTETIEKNKDAVTDDFKEMLTTVIDNVSHEADQDPKLLERLKTIQTVVQS